MSGLASALAVVTASRGDRRPCGLLVSSICSYSINPPSVLVAIDQASRSLAALIDSNSFGVNLLAATESHIASTFAGRGHDKFAGLPWQWDGAVPRLLTASTYLHCTTSRVVMHGDHAVVIGDVGHLHAQPSAPLVYYRRRYDWRLEPRTVVATPTSAPCCAMPTQRTRPAAPAGAPARAAP
jgi:flavin reductase (DIM6/NTAB) family NADH-FMN oxidoreductase RutF